MTLELLSMSLLMMLAAPLAQSVRKPWVITLAVLVLALVHSLSALVGSYTALLGLRIVAGIAAGTLLLMVNTTIAASSDPVRLYGACSMATVTVGLLLLLITPPLIAGLGLAGVYAPLALVALLVLAFVRLTGSTAIADSRIRTGNLVELSLGSLSTADSRYTDIYSGDNRDCGRRRTPGLCGEFCLV